MTTRIAYVIKNNLFLLQKNFTKQLTLNVTRSLFSQNALGLEGYKNSRDYINNQFINADEKFREKMWEVAQDNEKTVFSEDLKNLVHLIKKNEKDLELLKLMLIKYHKNQMIRTGTFVFGTVVMRALHYFDEPDLGLELFKNPDLNGFFEQFSSYHVMMDLLFNHGRYEDVNMLYNDLMEKNINGITHPKNSFILVIGACYKQNTPESFERAQYLLSDYQRKGYVFPRRALSFASVLALKQNKPEVALELISLCLSKGYIDVRCIKLEVYVALKDYEKINFLLNSSILKEDSYKVTFFKDSFEKLETLIKTENLDENHETVKTVNKAKKLDLVQNMNLEDHIMTEINMTKFSNTVRRYFRRDRYKRPSEIKSFKKSSRIY